MKKKYLVLFACALLMIFLCACSASDALYSNWGIQLPSGAHEVYAKSIGARDATNYTVYEYSSNAELGNLFSRQDKIQPLYHNSAVKAAEDVALELSVPDEFQADFSSCQKYYRRQDDGSQLFIFYEQEVCRLYVVEIFM